MANLSTTLKKNVLDICSLIEVCMQMIIDCKENNHQVSLIIFYFEIEFIF